METKTSSTASVASPATRKRRKKRLSKGEDLVHQRMLRFGETELLNVEATRRALEALGGCDVTFSDAARRLLSDKVAVAGVEALALAIERAAGPDEIKKIIATFGPLAEGEVPSAPAALPPELMALLGKLQQMLGRCQGSLNVIAKQLNFAVNDLGYSLTQSEVDDGLVSVLALRRILDRLEQWVFTGVQPVEPKGPDESAQRGRRQTEPEASFDELLRATKAAIASEKMTMSWLDQHRPKAG